MKSTHISQEKHEELLPTTRVKNVVPNKLLSIKTGLSSLCIGCILSGLYADRNDERFYFSCISKDIIICARIQCEERFKFSPYANRCVKI